MARRGTLLKYYLDTSLLVAALTPETFTLRAQLWLRSNYEEQLTISDWVITEFSSALAMKVRTGALVLEDRAQALTTLAQMCITLLHVEDVRRSDFRVAANFADQHRLGLRASDALHVAIATERGATIVTLDRKLAEAATHLNVPVGVV